VYGVADQLLEPGLLIRHILQVGDGPKRTLTDRPSDWFLASPDC
jgi:hypothetical protein